MQVREVRIIMDNLINAIKANKIDDAEKEYQKLESLLGEEAAEKLFEKIEIKLLGE